MHTPSNASAAELARALRELEPRAAALLRHRLLEGRSDQACAALYGISAEALAVHLLRATLALEERLGHPVRRLPVEARGERDWAEALTLGLQRHAGTGPGVAVALRLAQLSGPVRAELAAAERQEAQSPGRRRNEWLRRLAVALLIAFTAWYTLGRQEPERPAAPAARPR